MKRKELFYAVIGGCFGAAITMLVGLFTPIKVDAQSQPTDAQFGTLRCREIHIVNTQGQDTVSIKGDEESASIKIRAHSIVPGQPNSEITFRANAFGADIDMGKISIKADKNSCDLSMSGERNIIKMFNQKKNIGAVEIATTDRGGSVSVKGKPHNIKRQMFDHRASSGRASIRIDKEGNGVFEAWDANGRRR